MIGDSNLTDDAQPSPEDAARQLMDLLAVKTEHVSLTRAFRELCESTIKMYDGTERQQSADWAREVLRALDKEGLW
jgi:hypothetical protein